MPNSSKLFGEILVERGIITAEQLLSALMEQLVLMPSIYEVVYKGHLITAEQFLKALGYQSRHECDFRKACQDLGMWTPEIEARCNDSVHAIKIPIGQILVRQGSATFQGIACALEEHLADRPRNPGCPANDATTITSQGLPTSPESAPAVVAAPAAPMTAPLTQQIQAPPHLNAVLSTLDFGLLLNNEPSSSLTSIDFDLPHSAPSVLASEAPTIGAIPSEISSDRIFHPIDPALLSTYSELLTETRVTAMRTLIRSYLATRQKGISPQEPNTLFATLGHELRELKGMARFIRASITEEVLEQLEITLSDCQNSSLDEKEIETLQSLYDEALNSIVVLRDTLLETTSEESYWQKNQAALTHLSRELASCRRAITNNTAGLKVA